jgi:hypothetical protein
VTVQAKYGEINDGVIAMDLIDVMYLDGLVGFPAHTTGSVGLKQNLGSNIWGN